MKAHFEESIRETEARILASECGMDMDNARAITEKIREMRERVAPAVRGWQVGPFRVENQLSLTGVVSVLMILGAMTGGWYHFNYMVEGNEQAIMQIQKDTKEHGEVQAAINQKVSDALSLLNYNLGQTTQELHDMKEIEGRK